MSGKLLIGSRWRDAWKLLERLIASGATGKFRLQAAPLIMRCVGRWVRPDGVVASDGQQSRRVLALEDNSPLADYSLHRR